MQSQESFKLLTERSLQCPDAFCESLRKQRKRVDEIQEQFLKMSSKGWTF